MKMLRYIAYTLPIALLALPFVAGAQNDYLLVKDLPFINNTTNLSTYLSGLFRLGIGLAVTLAIVMIVYGGIQYMVSDVPGIKVNAKETIKNAILGLLLVLASWLILYTINPELVRFNLIGSLDNAARGVQIIGGTPGGSGNTNTTEPDGVLTYQPNIQYQQGHASPLLQSFLGCMAQTLPGPVGEISSISDEKIVSGDKTFEECAAGGQSVGCAHRRNSYHYGGSDACIGKSYAVDFGDERNTTELLKGASICGRQLGYVIRQEVATDHVHFSIIPGLSCQGAD